MGCYPGQMTMIMIITITMIMITNEIADDGEVDDDHGKEAYYVH